jgi:protein transport protein SEC61 subunit gamma-like protein
MVKFAELLIKIKNKLKEYNRVLKITKKPSKIEYQTVVKASALGIAVVGVIGFIMTIFVQLVK